MLLHYTYSDYEQWKGKWELIDSVSYAMSSQLVPKHQIVATNLITEFRIAFKHCKKCIAHQPIDYLILEETILQPDMLMCANQSTKNF